MENQLTGTQYTSSPDRSLAALTERHLSEWLELLDHLQDTHASTNQLTYCRSQVTRLQLDLYQLRNS